MNYRWIGALLVVIGCGIFGYSAAVSHRRNERYLSELMELLEYMECDLRYRRIPLSETCRSAAERGKGSISALFIRLAAELENQVSPDVLTCMENAVSNGAPFGKTVTEILADLGNLLGKFDLEGQITGLHSVKQRCALELDNLRSNRDSKLRSYQTLALCAGAALAILLV